MLSMIGKHVQKPSCLFCFGSMPSMNIPKNVLGVSRSQHIRGRMICCMPIMSSLTTKAVEMVVW